MLCILLVRFGPCASCQSACAFTCTCTCCDFLHGDARALLMLLHAAYLQMLRVYLHDHASMARCLCRCLCGVQRKSHGPDAAGTHAAGCVHHGWREHHQPGGRLAVAGDHGFLQQVCLPHQHDYLQQRAVVPGFLPVRTTAHAFLSLHRSACKVFTMKAASYAHAMRVVNCKPSRRRLHHMRMPCEW